MNFAGKIYLVIYQVYIYHDTWYINHKSIYLVYTRYIPCLNFPGFPDAPGHHGVPAAPPPSQAPCRASRLCQASHVRPAAPHPRDRHDLRWPLGPARLTVTT
jgi:hypothetical protein